MRLVSTVSKRLLYSELATTCNRKKRAQCTLGRLVDNEIREVSHELCS